MNLLLAVGGVVLVLSKGREEELPKGRIIVEGRGEKGVK